MKTQRDVIVRVNTLSVFKRGWEYNLFLAQDVRRDTAERWVNSAKRGKKKKNISLFASFQQPILSEDLSFCISIAAFCWLSGHERRCFVFSIDLRWPLVYLMTGWLPMRKHFITSRYSKQVKLLRGQHLSCAHGLSGFDHAEIKMACSLVSPHVLSACSAPCVWANYPWCMHRLSLADVLQMCFADDAHVQYLT